MSRLERWFGGCCRPVGLALRFLVGAALAAGLLRSLGAV